VSPVTKKLLKAAAKERHGGNVSALIEELAGELRRQQALDRLWAWYGGPELTDEERRRIDAELYPTKPVRRRRKAA
jgi:hypothetical protein